MTAVLTAPTTATATDDVLPFEAELDRYGLTPDETAVHELSRPATIGAVVPANDEAATLRSVLEAVLRQARLPDVAHVVVNTTTDASLCLRA